MQAVDALCRGADSSVETERDHSAAHVIVYRLWNTNHRHPFLRKFMSDLKAAITADGNERIESQAMKIFYDLSDKS